MIPYKAYKAFCIVTVIALAIGSVAVAQKRTLSIPDMFMLPTLAERQDCDSEATLRREFEHIFSTLSYMFEDGANDPSLVESNGCFLFRDVHGADAGRVIAEMAEILMERRFTNGHASWVGMRGIFPDDSRTNPSMTSFTFRSQNDYWMELGILGFDLANKDGLLMYVYAFHSPTPGE